MQRMLVGVISAWLIVVAIKARSIADAEEIRHTPADDRRAIAA
jgi:hypothetical protein